MNIYSGIRSYRKRGRIGLQQGDSGKGLAIPFNGERMGASTGREA